MALAFRPDWWYIFFQTFPRLQGGRELAYQRCLGDKGWSMIFTFICLVAFLALVYIAPVKVVIIAIAMLVVVATAVRFSAKVVTGTAPTYLEALRAVGFSLSIVAVLALGLLVLMLEEASLPQSFSAVPTPLLIVSPLLGYTLGFRMSLGASFLRSAVIAVMSSAISLAILIPLVKALHV